MASTYWVCFACVCAELATLEMRKALDTEKDRALWRLRKQIEHKFKRMLEDTKKKQWVRIFDTGYAKYHEEYKHRHDMSPE